MRKSVEFHNELGFIERSVIEDSEYRHVEKLLMSRMRCGGEGRGWVWGKGTVNTGSSGFLVADEGEAGKGEGWPAIKRSER